jgi:hypothetical protein
VAIDERRLVKEFECAHERAVAAAHPVPDRLLNVLRHEGLELGLRPFMVEKGRALRKWSGGISRANQL